MEIESLLYGPSRGAESCSCPTREVTASSAGDGNDEVGTSWTSAEEGEDITAAFRSPIVFGQPVAELDGDHEALYICEFSAFLEASKSLTIDCVYRFGIALPYLYVGDGFRYVWHLQKAVGLTLLSRHHYLDQKTKIWFFVQRSATTFVNTLITRRLACHMASVVFQKRLNHGSFGVTSQLLANHEEILVQMIFRDDLELQVMCPFGKLPGLTLSSILIYAVNCVHEIRLQFGDHSFAERGTSSDFNVFLAKCLLSIRRAGDGNLQPTLSLNCVTTAQPQTQGCASSADHIRDVSVQSQPGRQLSSPSCPVHHNFAYELDGDVQIDETGPDVKLVKVKEECGLHEAQNCNEINMQTHSNIKDCTVVNPMQEQDQNSSTSSMSDGACAFKPILRLHTERHMLAECPLCGMMFRSSKSRLNSLVSHINRRHKENRDILLQVILKKYHSSLLQGGQRA